MAWMDGLDGDVDGRMAFLGAPPSMTFSPVKINMNRLTITGSLLANQKDTRDMLDFCARHNIVVFIHSFIHITCVLFYQIITQLIGWSIGHNRRNGYDT
jgi:hypothetical protein